MLSSQEKPFVHQVLAVTMPQRNFRARFSDFVSTQEVQLIRILRSLGLF